MKLTFSRTGCHAAAWFLLITFLAATSGQAKTDAPCSTKSLVLLFDLSSSKNAVYLAPAGGALATILAGHFADVDQTRLSASTAVAVEMAALLESDLVSLDAQQMVTLVTTAKGSDRCNDRWMTTRDETYTLEVFVLSKEGAEVEIKITEEERKTRLSEDISTLIKLIPVLESLKSVTLEYQLIRREYVLRELRAVVKVVVQQPQDDGDPKELAKASLTTGPAEHWALSANAVLNEVEEAKISDDNTFDVKDTPGELLVGLDYYIGDLMTDWDGHEFKKNLGLKLLVEASSRPGDRLGAALTYRGDAGPLSFRLVSPFVGALWTREEELDADGNVESRGDHDGPEFVAGLSFNLDRALEWLKPKKSDGE